MFANDGISGGFNSDVLSAEPATAEAKLSLVEEIKNRAKGCIGSRNYPEAIKLYSKAIELSTDVLPAKAILHANRSMCYLGMNNCTSALEDANIAVSTDSTYIKGYYRVAMAQNGLKNYRGAREALMQGLTLKPDDKELKAALVKVEADLARPSTIAMSSSSSSSSSGKTATITTSSKPAAIPAISKPAATKPAPKNSAASTNDDDDEEDLKNLNMRGYKITSDGKKTTFFNNELDETAKTLIGDIAPKKLDPASPVPLATASTDTIGSAWNTAGTYEERIVTPWVEETLTAYLTSIYSTVASDKLVRVDAFSVSSVRDVRLQVTGVENMNGHAQVTMMRGKKKHMCDFNTDVKWKMTVHTTTEVGDYTVEGKLNYIDITADKDYEVNGVEVTHVNGTAATAGTLAGYASNFYNTYVRKADKPDGLQKLVHNALMRFCDEFKTK